MGRPQLRRPHGVKTKFSLVSCAAFFLPAALVYLVGAATRAAIPGMAFDALRADFGASAAQVAAIASSGVFGCLVFVGSTGFLVDRFGWRRLILPGVVLQVFGEWLLYSQADLSLVCLGSFLNGGGRTVGYLTLLKLLDVEFDRRYFAPLLGVFYVFSYGGTYLGTSRFCEWGLAHFGWRTLMENLNLFTLLCGAVLALFLWAQRRRNPAPESAPPAAEPSRTPAATWRDLGRAFTFRSARCAFYLTACGIFVYWSILAVVAKKYLADVCGLPSDAMGLMNRIVIAEMTLGGLVSFGLGNRRKVFQVAGACTLAAGCAALFAGTWLAPAAARRMAACGFIALGAGYGFTGVGIAALRENVPSAFAASVIGLANFCANGMLILLMQFAGWLFDRYATAPGVLAVSPLGYRILLGVYLLLVLPAVCCAASVRETRGRNLYTSRP